MKSGILLSRLFLILAFLGSASGLSAAAFSGLIAFGDSFTDTGNTSVLSGGVSPGAGYHSGRYSNGPVWIEHMAACYGMPAPVNSVSGGRNYAFGGAFTGNGGSVPSLPQQVAMFTGGGGTFLPTDLVLVWAGANDFLLGGQTNPTIPANNVLGIISTLAGAGARNILVPNLPDLGNTPALLSTGDPVRIGGATLLSQGFNAALASGLSNLRQSLGINLWELDVYGIGKELKANPSAFGFTDTTQSALLSGNAAHAAEYLYWDTIHPTARVHEILGGNRSSSCLTDPCPCIPEPGAFALMALGAGAVFLRRVRAGGLHDDRKCGRSKHWKVRL